jgi:hypothetical protein
MEAIDKWHKSKTGHFLFGLVELAIFYGFASWAIDSGQLWQYAFALVFLFGALQNLVKAFKSHKHGQKSN